MLIQPQCFMAPCDPIEVGDQPGRSILTNVPTNIRDYPVYTAGQYPTTPDYTPPVSETPVFKTSTESLDWYRVAFLIAGIWIGAVVLKNL